MRTTRGMNDMTGDNGRTYRVRNGNRGRRAATLRRAAVLPLDRLHHLPPALQPPHSPSPHPLLLCLCAFTCASHYCALSLNLALSLLCLYMFVITLLHSPFSLPARLRRGLLHIFLVHLSPSPLLPLATRAPLAAPLSTPLTASSPSTRYRSILPGSYAFVWTATTGCLRYTAFMHACLVRVHAHHTAALAAHIIACIYRHSRDAAPQQRVGGAKDRWQRLSFRAYTLQRERAGATDGWTIARSTFVCAARQDRFCGFPNINWL